MDDMNYSSIMVYCLGYVTDKYIANKISQYTFVKLWGKSDQWSWE